MVLMRYDATHTTRLPVSAAARVPPAPAGPALSWVPPAPPPAVRRWLSQPHSAAPGSPRKGGWEGQQAANTTTAARAAPTTQRADKEHWGYASASKMG